jgi:hypothetical protein
VLSINVGWRLAKLLLTWDGDLKLGVFGVAVTSREDVIAERSSSDDTSSTTPEDCAGTKGDVGI